MPSDVTIQGLDELLRKLDALDDAVSANTMEAALKSGGQLIANRASDIVHKVSGNLARSIHVETVEKSAQRVKVAVGTDVEYAAREEFGFSGRDSRGRNYNQPPHPYMRPAWEEKKDEAQQEVGDALRVIVSKFT